MVNTLKEIFDLPYFHGRLTDEEAYNLCQAKLTNHGKTQVYIWYLSELDGKLQGVICGYLRDSEVPLFRLDTSNFMDTWMPFVQELSGVGPAFLEEMVERQNPHQRSELGRIAILDSLDYCCLKNLIQRIDELQLPAIEKEELKKLVRGFQLLLASKIPNPNEL